MNNTTPHRIDEYDVAKGIGILLVVVGHALPQDSLLRVFIYSFHMPLFFLVSGLVMKEFNTKITMAELWKQDKRLIFNYLFWTIMYWLYDCISCMIGIKKASITFLALEIYQGVTLFGVSVLWFLSTLLLGKWLVIFICDNLKTPLNRIIASCVLYIIGSIFAIMLPNGLTVSGGARIIYYPLCTVLRTLIMSSFIMMGYAIRAYAKIFIQKGNIVVVGGMTLVSFFLVSLLYRYTKGVDFHFSMVDFFPVTFMAGISGSMFALCVSILVSKLNILRSILLFFGKNSLFIMATHEYFGIKQLLANALNLMGLEFSEVLNIVVNLFLLLMLEIILIRLIKPSTDRIINSVIKR